MIGLVHKSNIKRSQAVGTNGRTQSQTVYTGLSCLVLPMNSKTAIEHDFSIGRAYEIFFEGGQDVQPADQILYNGGTYIVHAVRPYAVPIVGHVLALCEQEIS